MIIHLKWDWAGVLLKEHLKKLFIKGFRFSVVTPNSQNSKPDCEPHVTLLKYSTTPFLSEFPVYLCSVWYIVLAFLMPTDISISH